MGTSLATFKSASRPGVTYDVIMGDNQHVYCSCPAWKFQRKPALQRTCKHIEQFRAAAAKRQPVFA